MTIGLAVAAVGGCLLWNWLRVGVDGPLTIPASVFVSHPVEPGLPVFFGEPVIENLSDSPVTIDKIWFEGADELELGEVGLVVLEPDYYLDHVYYHYFEGGKPDDYASREVAKEDGWVVPPESEGYTTSPYVIVTLKPGTPMGATGLLHIEYRHGLRRYEVVGAHHLVLCDKTQFTGSCPDPPAHLGFS